MLPFPFVLLESTYRRCCGKTICAGCLLGQAMVDMKGGIQPTESSARICAFCRTDGGTDNDNLLEQEMKLA